MKKTKKLILVLIFTYLVSLFHIPEVSATCGYISNVAVDSYELPSLYRHSRMIRVNDTDIYIVSAVEYSAPGYLELRTYQIYSNNGTINTTMIDKDSQGNPPYGWGLDIIHVGSDMYITCGSYSSVPKVQSWRVLENGTVSGPHDALDLGYVFDIDCGHNYLDILELDNDVCLVAYEETSTSKIYLESFYVNSDTGDITSRLDSVMINGTGNSPRLIALDSNTVCVIYQDNSGDGWLKTYDVDPDGDIGDADDHYEDWWEFEPDTCNAISYNIINVYGDKYLLAYNNGSGLVLKTVRIYDNGVIIESFIDDMILDSYSGCSRATPFRVNEDIMAVAYVGADGDGFMRSFNITYLGVFPSDSYLDTWEYSSDNPSNYPSVIHMAGDYFVISGDEWDANSCYEDITMYTFQVECATGDIGGIGSLYVNAYDEGSLEPIDFNISFFDSSWGNSYSETYCNTSCTPCPCNDCSDSWNITFDQLPQGTDCYMIVGNGSYHDRYFMMDIYDEFISFEGTTYYTLCLNVFLAPESARLYNIKVIDNFYNPLDDVEIRVKRYIDPVIGTINISTLHTDSYGLAQIYLIAEVPYIFNCSKEDYIPVNFVWIPPDADNVTKTIKMTWIYEEGPDIENISMEQLVLTAYNTTTMEIFYLNLNEDNQYVDISVYDYFNDSFLLTTYHVTENPNNITQLFTWTDYELVGDILKVTAVATRINESTYTLTGYFNIQQAREQVGDAYLHLILSVGLCFFGLTIASPKTIFGPVGIIVMIIGLGVTAFAVQTWYIHLIQAVEIILLIFIILVFKEEGVHAI